MSNSNSFDVGDLVEAYFGGDTWIRGCVVGIGFPGKTVLVKFPNGIIDYAPISTTRKVSPLRALAEQSE